MPQVYEVTLNFITEMLGTVPKNQDVYEAHVLSKIADLGDEAAAEELNTTENIEERGWTGFHVDENGPFIFDYMIKGYLKNAARTMKKVAGSQTSNMRAYIKVIDTLIFPRPRRLHLNIPDNAWIENEDGTRSLHTLSRPLRASTPQGDRVAVVKSDLVPAGTTVSFRLTVLDGAPEATLREWFDYGAWSGIGQWRNASYGRFTYDMALVSE